uniref:Uncharacterized protein n=1 Tax=Arundo donax TaxID=35708 RepID=A0A0A8Z875_ARUDO
MPRFAATSIEALQFATSSQHCNFATCGLRYRRLARVQNT